MEKRVEYAALVYIAYADIYTNIGTVFVLLLLSM